MESKKIFLYSCGNAEYIADRFHYYINKLKMTDEYLHSSDTEQCLEVETISSDCLGSELSLDFITSKVKNAWKSLFLLTGDFFRSPNITYGLQLALRCCISSNSVSMVVVLFDCDELSDDYEYLNKVIWKRQKTISLGSAEKEECFFLKLQSYLKSEPDDFDEIFPAGNLALGMAYCHFLGFLKIIAPGLTEAIKKYCEENDINPKNFPCKYYELLPETCAIEDIIKDKNGVITRRGILEFKVNERTFCPSIYSIEDEGKVYYCICGYPSVIGSVFKMDEEMYIKISKTERRIFLQRYFHAIKQLVNNPRISECFKKHEMLPYNESCIGPRQVLLEAIKSDVHSEKMEQKYQKNPILSLFSIESSTIENDVHLIYFKDTKDQALRLYQHFEGKKKVFFEDQTENNLVFKSFEQGLDSSRWVVIVLSKKALEDHMVCLKCLCAVDKTLSHRRMNIIPVVNGNELDQLPEFLHQSNYIDWTDKYYLEKLWIRITGEDIELELKMPVYDLASGLAWGLVVNYLRFTLPYLCKNLKEALHKHGENNILCPQKEYFICPRSCKFTNNLSEMDKDLVKIEEIKLESVKVDQAGAKQREFGYGNLYKVQGKYLVLASIPRPFDVLGKIAELGEAAFSYADSNKQAKKLFEELKKIVETYPNITGDSMSCCKMLFFDDNVEKLSNLLACHVEQDLKEENAVTGPQSVPQPMSPSVSQPVLPLVSQSLGIAGDQNIIHNVVAENSPNTDSVEPIVEIIYQRKSDGNNKMGTNDSGYLSQHSKIKPITDVTKPPMKTCDSSFSNAADVEEQFYTVGESEGEEIRKAIMETESECSSTDIVIHEKSDDNNKMATDGSDYRLQHSTVEHSASQTTFDEFVPSFSHKDIYGKLLTNVEPETRKHPESGSRKYHDISMNQKSDVGQKIEAEILSGEDIENEDEEFLTVAESEGDQLREQIRESEMMGNAVNLCESPDAESDDENLEQDIYYDTQEYLPSCQVTENTSSTAN